ncbi:MAG: fatty acid desaturase [Alphaproteobacteria bacterium]|nr:fatty acid desaturase [Alphaproteobacteria bacterium]
MTLDHLADDLERALDAEPPTHLSRNRAPAELLVPPDVGDLLRMAAVDWAIVIGAWAAMAALPVWTWPAWILVVTGRIHGFGVLLHDAAHMPLKRKTAQVRLLEVLCGYPLATTLNAMRYHHLRHHRDSGMPTDPYFKAGVEERPVLYALNVLRGVLLMPFWTVRTVFGLVAWALPGFRTTYARVFLQDRSGLDLTESREVLACAREDLGQLVFQLGVAGLFVAFPGAVLWGYVVPGTLAGLLAARRLLVEHRYVPTPDRRVETLLATTNDHQIGSPLAWLVAPHHIGYHVVHHVHPSVGLRHLPALRDWYVANTPGYPAPR